ncbi:hypothetical protein ACFLYF_02800 [Chloroflexota bacterium]
MCLESEVVGRKYAGMAVGLLYTLQRIGPFTAPTLGNSLSGIGLGMPFLFWAGLFVLGAFVLIFFVKETGWKSRRGQDMTYIAS